MKDTINPSIPYVKDFQKKADGIFKSTKIRSGNGFVSYTVSQPYGLSIPQVGVNFGNGKSINQDGWDRSTIFR